MATDPVCAMPVQPNQTTPHFNVQGVTYWFCSVTCRDEFAQEPQRFLIDSVRRGESPKASSAMARHAGGDMTLT